jgi:hypothetical protein
MPSRQWAALAPVIARVVGTHYWHSRASKACIEGACFASRAPRKRATHGHSFHYRDIATTIAGSGAVDQARAGALACGTSIATLVEMRFKLSFVGFGLACLLGASGCLDENYNPETSKTLSWSERMAASLGGEVTGVAADPRGGVVVAGSFNGALELAGGRLVSESIYSDAFLYALDSKGRHVWSKRFGGSGLGRAINGVAVDGSGNILVIGGFRGTIDLGGPSLVAGPNGVSAFVAKLDPNGGHLWSKSFETTVNFLDFSVAVAPTGDVYLAGTLQGRTSFGGNIIGLDQAVSLYVVKLDANGSHSWSHTFTGTNDAHAASIAATKNGAVVAGAFSGTVDLGSGPLTSANETDLFVARFDNIGQTSWSRRFGGNGWETARVAVDAAENMFLAGGSTSADMNFGGVQFDNPDSQSRIVVAKLDPEGEHIWSDMYGATPNPASIDIAVDAHGDMFFAGINGYLGLDQGGPSGSSEYFVDKIDPMGKHVWSRMFAINDDGHGGPPCLAIDAHESPLLAGPADRPIDFGQGPLSLDAGDMFVAKLAP